MGGMVEEKKRLPWRLIVLAVVVLTCALLVGFIETAGRQGTIVGRYEQIENGMPREKILRILGDSPFQEACGRWAMWPDGPVVIMVNFKGDRVSDKAVREPVPDEQRMQDLHTWWRARRWAEQAYTAIHGPRH
jgi:hypothetical protein